MKKNQILLTAENAPLVRSIVNIKNPEWGEKRFNYNAEKLTNGFASSWGVGCNSAVLFESEYKFWVVASFK